MTAARIAVTGATGHVGGALVRRLQREGIPVVAIGRRRAPGVEEFRSAELGSVPASGLLDGIDAVVHLAADTGSGNISAEAEVAFAEGLSRVAADAGCRFVFVSSQAASETAPSRYGQTKYRIERLLLPKGAVIVRAGQVYGGPAAGLFGLLCRLVRAMPVLPDLRPRIQVQPIHVDDLASALVAAACEPKLKGRVLMVAGPPLSFGDFLAAIARHREGRWRARLPVPSAWLRIVLKLVSPVLGKRYDPTRLDSLTSLVPTDARADLAVLGMAPRPLADGLSRSGRSRHRLLLESGRFAAALGLGQIPGTMRRRYVRALECHGVKTALELPFWLMAAPRWIACLDLPSQRRDPDPGSLAWRLDVVTRLAEAEPALARRFLMLPGAHGRLRVLVLLVGAGLGELLIRALRPLLRRLATMSVPRSVA
jgi:NADH dehydrogenase